MKRLIAVIITLFAVFFTITVNAGVLDSIKGMAGNLSWTIIAGALTGIIVIGGLVTRAKWLSAVLIAIGALIDSVGLVFHGVGNALQDGKIEAEELKTIKSDCGSVKAQFANVVKILRNK